MPKRTLEELSHQIEKLEAQSTALMEAQNHLHATIMRLSTYALKLQATPLAIVDDHDKRTAPPA